MSKFAWVTDCHLDHIDGDPNALIRFAESLVVHNPTGILITGDVSIAKKLVYHLSAVERIVQRPIYFVLGNHDYWGADTTQVRKAMHELTNVSPFLRYMPTMLYQAATAATAVVGHDCWYDALWGDWQNSGFTMNDWTSMGDFVQVNRNKATIVATAKKLAFDGVTHIHNGIKSAVRYHRNVLVLTHVPPFPQCHIGPDGQPGSQQAMPWYVSKMLGDMLMDASKSFPAVTFTVLSGHTHGKSTFQAAKNLIVHTGAADYGHPALQGLIEVA